MHAHPIYQVSLSCVAWESCPGHRQSWEDRQRTQKEGSQGRQMFFLSSWGLFSRFEADGAREASPVWDFEKVQFPFSTGDSQVHSWERKTRRSLVVCSMADCDPDQGPCRPWKVQKGKQPQRAQVARKTPEPQEMFLRVSMGLALWGTWGSGMDDRDRLQTRQILGLYVECPFPCQGPLP